MEEYLDILDSFGNATGKTVLKSEAHKQGWFHNTAHVWFYTNDCEILLSQRAASKSIFPLLWDVSVAGHIDAGESIINGAIRETEEEIGLTIKANALKKIGINTCMQTYGDAIKDYEFHHTFISELKSPVEQLSIQKEEVETVKLVSFKQFKTLLIHSETNGHFVVSNKLYYEFVLETIQKLF